MTPSGCEMRTRPLNEGHRYAFDVLGELFFGKKFGFMSERSDVGGYMKSINTILPAFTLGGTMPSYLMKPFLFSSILLSPSTRGALGSLGQIENTAAAAVERRKQEMMDASDDKHDMLRKMIEINADRGEKINFSIHDIKSDSASTL